MTQADAWNSFCSISLVKGWLPVTCWSLVGVGLLALLVYELAHARFTRLAFQLVLSLVVGACGLLLAWLLSDVFVTFGVPLGGPVILAVGVGFAILTFFVCAAVQTRGWWRALAIVMVPVALVSTCLRVDSIYGEYQNIGSLFDYSPYPQFSAQHSVAGRDTITVGEWKKKVDSGSVPEVPAQGKLLQVNIPNPKSRFKARKALVWLPPAALAKLPPRLPVMVMLAGQPGSPNRYFEASNTISVLTAYARKHDGLAPIVVSPDQNTAASRNSLCSNTTKWGDAETYLTVDVPDWIRRHLPVESDAKDWTIGGFSQGGTCSTSLAPNHPELFGNVLAVDGELHPTDGSVAHMVKEYFHGDLAAYERQVPVNAIKAHAPSGQTMVLGAGENDHDSVKNIETIGKAAREAGWTVVEVVAKGTGHDWHAVNDVFQSALPWLCNRMGLGAAGNTGGGSDGNSATDNDNSIADSFASNKKLEVVQ